MKLSLRARKTVKLKLMVDDAKLKLSQRARKTVVLVSELALFTCRRSFRTLGSTQVEKPTGGCINEV